MYLSIKDFGTPRGSGEVKSSLAPKLSGFMENQELFGRKGSEFLSFTVDT